MTSQTLREARQYEEVAEKCLNQEERPAFHLATRIGWMNDPNGFSYYQGKYHMFYQYHPYSPVWGPMHWGHAVSEDLLHWEYLPVAMAPDTVYDGNGCFSGSAIVLPDGRHLLMYTGVQIKPKMTDGAFNPDIQTQCIAVGDGVDYVKYEKNPVLDETDLPEGCSKYDFRDPKIWQASDGTYRCIVGNRPADKSGQILLFSSPDAFEWKFDKVLIKNENRYGKMWECPDFFELDGKQVLLVSPQDMLPEDFEYHNGNGTLCIIGSYDEKTQEFVEECNQSVDYGIDFYAPQTVLAPDGRRIMIGWMQNWDTCNMRNDDQKWFGQMSLPREVSIRNGRLYQWPVRELENLRRDPVSYKDVLLKDGEELSLESVKGRMVDMELSIRPEDMEDLYEKFSIRFAQNDKYFTSVSFRPKENILKVDRKAAGSRRAIIHQRRSKVPCENGEIKLRIILDRCSVEIFVNDGVQTMTATIYTDMDADGITFLAEGAARFDITKYSLEL